MLHTSMSPIDFQKIKIYGSFREWKNGNEVSQIQGYTFEFHAFDFWLVNLSNRQGGKDYIS